ncbi:MFS transporter [Acidisoma cladoniae]|jgi:MFS family permease|uniref:MFS transporter n=1 Tax=Acidisoma cladoniae TaxID=3040935 RepID=UPI00254AB713|nr:MFS transporter [Acidisoma sp. PAMC 29798]
MPGLLKAPGFVRLWIAGGTSNAMLWLEVLAAALFTLQVTGSGFDVALVSAARSLPLLATGALIGVISDAIDRKRIVTGGLVLSALASASVGVLALLGVLRPWHIGVAALVSGLVYATEMPARRRMIAESAGPRLASRAVAIDSMTNYATRVAGPLLGGLAYQQIGLSGAFLMSATVSLGTAILVAGITHRQAVVRRMSLAVAMRDMREGFAFARGRRAILVLLAVTVITNLFGYSYTTLVTPLGKLVLHLSPQMIGVLAAAEPAGSLLAGTVLALRPARGHPLRWLAGGAAVLFLALVTAALLGMLAHPLLPILIALFLGGLGSAVYNIHQTTIVMADTPPELRSRVMGLITVCIGCWPLGMLIAGALILPLGLLGALASLGLGGLAAMAMILSLARR